MTDAHRRELPKQLAETLMTLVGIATTNKRTDLYYRRLGSMPHYTIALEPNGAAVAKIAAAPEDPLLRLPAAGMIEIVETTPQRGAAIGRLLLTDEAFAWAQYHDRSWVGRWMVRRRMAAAAIPARLEWWVKIVSSVIAAAVGLLAIARWLGWTP